MGNADAPARPGRILSRRQGLWCLISSGATCYHGLMFRPCSLLLMFLLAVPALAPASFAKECKCRLYEQRVEIHALRTTSEGAACCALIDFAAADGSTMPHRLRCGADRTPARRSIARTHQAYRPLCSRPFLVAELLCRV